VQELIRALEKPSKQGLQAICSVNGLPKTGNKPDLVRRIISCQFSSLLYCLPHHAHHPTRAQTRITHHPPQLSPCTSLTQLSKTVIEEVAPKQDSQRYEEVRHSVLAQTTPFGVMAPGYPPLGTPHTPAQSSTSRYPPATYPAAYGLPNGQRSATIHVQHTTSRPAGQARPKPPITPGFEFTHSPFYELKERLGEIRMCESLCMILVLKV